MQHSTIDLDVSLNDEIRVITPVIVYPESNKIIMKYLNILSAVELNY